MPLILTVVREEQLEKFFYYPGIKVFAALFPDIAQGLFLRPGRPVRPLAGQGVKDIHHGENTDCKWDFFSFQAVWIPGAIPFFMVVHWDIQRRNQVGNPGKQLLGNARVHVILVTAGLIYSKWGSGR